MTTLKEEMMMKEAIATAELACSPSPESKGMEERNVGGDIAMQIGIMLSNLLPKEYSSSSQKAEIEKRVTWIVNSQILSLSLSARQEADQRVAEAVRGERERVEKIIEELKKARNGHTGASCGDNYENGFVSALATLSAKIK